MIRPDVVVLELCQKRLPMLYRDLEAPSASPDVGFFQQLLTGLRSKDHTILTTFINSMYKQIEGEHVFLVVEWFPV